MSVKAHDNRSHWISWVRPTVTAETNKKSTRFYESAVLARFPRLKDCSTAQLSAVLALKTYAVPLHNNPGSLPSETEHWLKSASNWILRLRQSHSVISFSEESNCHKSTYWNLFIHVSNLYASLEIFVSDPGEDDASSGDHCQQCSHCALNRSNTNTWLEMPQQSKNKAQICLYALTQTHTHTLLHKNVFYKLESNPVLEPIYSMGSQHGNLHQSLLMTNSWMTNSADNYVSLVATYTYTSVLKIHYFSSHTSVKTLINHTGSNIGYFKSKTR